VKGVCANENALGEGGHHWAPKVVPFLTVTHIRVQLEREWKGF
jgi:hypothetical protein